MNEIKTGLEVVKLNPGKGMTVFDYAVIYERVGIASWLLSKNPEYKTVTSNWGEYPIHKAAYFGFVGEATDSRACMNGSCLEACLIS